MKEKLERFWSEYCDGFFAPLKQVQKARKTIDRKLQDVIIVDMSEMRTRTIMELDNMGLSIRPDKNIGYIYEEE